MVAFVFVAAPAFEDDDECGGCDDGCACEDVFLSFVSMSLVSCCLCLFFFGFLWRSSSSILSQMTVFL